MDIDGAGKFFREELEPKMEPDEFRHMVYRFAEVAMGLHDNWLLFVKACGLDVDYTMRKYREPSDLATNEDSDLWMVVSNVDGSRTYWQWEGEGATPHRHLGPRDGNHFHPYKLDLETAGKLMELVKHCWPTLCDGLAIISADDFASAVTDRDDII